MSGDRLFGWSYPPGCSGPPEGPEPSPLEDAVLGLLEDAGVPTEVFDQIMRLIDDWQIAEAAHEDNGPYCEDEEC